MSKKQEPTARYGGRALRHGVMMVGPKAIAVAVRQPNGEIVTETEAFTMSGQWAKDIPFVRGLVSFVGMLKLARTANSLEGRLSNGGSKVKALLPQLAPGVGAMLADRLAREIGRHAPERSVSSIEAIAGVTLPFVAFRLSSGLPGVGQLWRYHGAEHKAVNAAEAGLELTPDNAASMSRIHPRCGTVFAFWGLLGGAIAKSYIGKMPPGRKRNAFGILSGPVILSSAYEAIRLGWQLRNNRIARFFFTPAWRAQWFTTSEPLVPELEVAIASLQAVMDFERTEA